MRYEQPKVEVLGAATAVVQSNGDKANQTTPDNIPMHPLWSTGSAYQSDE